MEEDLVFSCRGQEELRKNFAARYTGYVYVYRRGTSARGISKSCGGVQLSPSLSLSLFLSLSLYIYCSIYILLSCEVMYFVQQLISSSFRCNDSARNFWLAFRLHFVATTALPLSLLKQPSFRANDRVKNITPLFVRKDRAYSHEGKTTSFPKEVGSKLRRVFVRVPRLAD